MIAKAEIMQASIGVSCNEQDLHDCRTDPDAAPSHEVSSQSDRAMPSSTQVEHVTGKKIPSLVKETGDQNVTQVDGTALEAGQTAAAERPMARGDKPYR